LLVVVCHNACACFQAREKELGLRQAKAAELALKDALVGGARSFFVMECT
jgi:hypothetical protein